MVMESTGGIVCHLADSKHDRMRALDFIEQWFFKWNGCSPPVSTGDILIASESDEIVGAVNLDFRDEATPFPVEEMYDFFHLRNYFPGFDRRQFVQGGRWSASMPDVSRLLLTAIARYSMPRGVRYMIGEVKQTSIDRLEALGIRFMILYGVFPNFETLPSERQKYYREPPPLRLMVIHMENLL